MLTQNRTIDEIELLLAGGDLAFVAARGTVDGRPCVYVDLYRVQKGLIAERWGFPQDPTPTEPAMNANGLL